MLGGIKGLYPGPGIYIGIFGIGPIGMFGIGPGNGGGGSI